MGVDLTNEKNNWFYLNHISWRNALLLAYEFGWSPVGTLPPYDGDTDDWDIWDYTSNSFQYITSVDALAMGEAIRSAIQTLPDNEALPWKYRPTAEGQRCSIPYYPDELLI